MATQNVLMKLVCNIRYAERGWSETYYLPQTTFAGAKPKGELITSWRACTLAPGGVLNWARLSFVDRPRQTVAVIGRPLKPLANNTGPQTSPLNTVEVAFHYRFETSDGNWVNRLLRGVGDDVIRDQQIGVAGYVFPQPWGPGDLPDITNPATSQLDIISGFLQVVLNETVYAQKLPGPVIAWDVNTFNRCVFRKISKRDTGAGFGIPRGRRRARKVVPAG